MKINEYQKAAMRTASTTNSNDLILNGALGLCGESGEVADVVKKHLFQGHELDKQKIIKELGDVCWYIAILAEGLDVDLETVMQLNIEKLRNRYPEGFEAEKSIFRKEYDEFKTCPACSGSGYYDNTGSPKCGACDGEGVVKI